MAAAHVQQARKGQGSLMEKVLERAEREREDRKRKERHGYLLENTDHFSAFTVHATEMRLFTCLHECLFLKISAASSFLLFFPRLNLSVFRFPSS